MAQPLRVEFEDAIYHLCARNNARQAIFDDERDCARFLKLLSESAQRFERLTFDIGICLPHRDPTCTKALTGSRWKCSVGQVFALAKRAVKCL